MKREQGPVEFRQAKFKAGASPTKRRKEQNTDRALKELVQSCFFLLGRLYYSIVPSSEMSGSVRMFVPMFVRMFFCLYVYAPLARPFEIKI